MFHVKLNLLIHQTSKRITESNDDKREENATLKNQEISSEKSITQSFTEKHIGQDTRAVWKANNCNAHTAHYFIK